MLLHSCTPLIDFNLCVVIAVCMLYNESSMYVHHLMQGFRVHCGSIMLPCGGSNLVLCILNMYV